MNTREWKILDEVSKKLDPELRDSLARIIVKQDRLLWIFRQYPKWQGSLEGLLRISRYWKEQKKEITKELLEIYDIPFNVNEFAMIIEWLEEKEE